jgi:type IV fimbrial biogenesis protein FimT
VLDHAQGGLVLTHRRSSSGGFSLIELLVVISLIAFLMLITVRAFGGWTADAKVRNTAETLQNALRLAQANAVARNRVSVFALTNGTPAYNATPAANGTNWFSKLVALPGSDETAVALGTIETSTVARQNNVSITGASPVLCFNSLGQLATETATYVGLSTGCTAPASNTPVAYTVSRTGASRSLRVLVSLGGQVRMCDVAKTLSNTNPDGCP